jgi:hypothetical protein
MATSNPLVIRQVLEKTASAGAEPKVGDRQLILDETGQLVVLQRGEQRPADAIVASSIAREGFFSRQSGVTS